MKWAPRALLAVLGAGCGRAPEPREEPIPVEVHCVAAQRQSVDVHETLRGRVAAPPGGDLPVASQVPGRVLDVLVHEGDLVASGTIVASIDGSSSRDALRQADAVVAEAKAAEANAEATIARVRQLVARGIAAKQELDDATARKDQASANVSAGIAAADLARRTLGRVQVRSTFSGVVTRVWRGSGALVDGTAATPIVQLAATALAEFDVAATERQLVGIAAGQAATVTLASGGEPIAGSVAVRPTALDPASGLGIVRIVIERRASVILGLFGTATVTLGQRAGVIIVPAEAIRGAAADGAEIVVCKNGKAEIRAVDVGFRDVQRVEIVRGLEVGELVAIDHVLGVSADSPIVEAD